MKNAGQDFLNKLDDLIHDYIDDELRITSVDEFRCHKQLMEEKLAERIFNKFIKDGYNYKDNL